MRSTRQAQGARIDVHFAVLPALARNKLPDPVFFLAGGPGQSAIDMAGQLSQMLARFGNRRDIVLVDQRGTGRSAALNCDEDAATLPLRESTRPARQVQRMLRLPAHASVAAARRLASIHHHAGHGRPGRRAAGAGRRAHQPDRRVLRHACGAGIHAPVSALGAPRGAGRCGAGGHGVAAGVCHRRPGRLRRPAARLRERCPVPRAPPGPARDRGRPCWIRCRAR